MISQGKTEGVFQLESGGMKQFMRELQPTRLEDLIAGISLYRPGPMDFIPKYIKGKNNQNDIQYTHESLKPILNTTYGCIVYQEQVMQIVRDLAGYSLGRSDLVRRAMSKKKASVMAEERKNFVYGIGDDVPGCVKNGIPVDVAEKIFDEMTDFAKYAFNKSHAACYAVVGYQTAWLKYHYPVEFMAALMTSVMDNTPKVSGYIEECKKMGIKLLPPDINEGYAHFSVFDGKIRFGLAAIKNVGKNVIKAVVADREKNGYYKSLTEFCNRLSGGELNKRCVESFIKSGAFDSFGKKRSQYMSSYKSIIEGIGQAKKNNIEGQLNLFDMGNNIDNINSMSDVLPDIDEFPENKILAMEKEVLGIYVSGHPLSAYEEILKRKTSCSSRDFMVDTRDYENPLKDNQSVIIGGLISAISIKYTKNNKQMAFLSIEDMHGIVEAIVFPNVYEKFSHLITEENVIIIEGRVNISDDENGKIICESIRGINEPEEEKKWLSVGIIIGKSNNIKTEDIIPILSKYPGNCPVYIKDIAGGVTFKADRKYWIKPNDNIVSELGSIIGNDCITIKEK